MTFTRARRLGRYGWAVAFVAVVLLASTITRLVVFILSDHASASTFRFVRAFAVGALYDLLVGAWLAAPMLMYLTVISPGRYQKVQHRALRRAALAVFLAGVLFVIA